MNPSESDIHDYEASRLINKLYHFLGPINVDSALEKHKRNLGLSGPIVSEYTIKHKHPWWNAFISFFELKNTAKSIKRNFTPEIRMLSADAKMVTSLLKFMPVSVQNKYKRDLVDPDRASDYLFEIRIAWHFYSIGNELQWYKDDGKKHPEFLVKTPDFNFNVECKRISVDISRKIKREDFNRFIQTILPEVNKLGYGGNIDVILDGRLDGAHINTLSSDILGLIKSKNIKGEFEVPLGHVSLNLNEMSGKTFNVREHDESMLSDGLHVALFSSRRDGDNLIDPIKISLKSKKPDKVLQGIYDKVYEAAKNQLDKSMPGIIVCFIYDLRELSNNSGLQLMTCKLLNKDELSHIARIEYCSEKQIHKLGNNAESYDNQRLFFNNPNCKFEKVRTYKF